MKLSPEALKLAIEILGKELKGNTAHSQAIEACIQELLAIGSY
jgi:hypothetical protein